MTYFDRFGDPEFRIFDGLNDISSLTPIVGLAIAGIIINTQVMFLNAWMTSLEDNFWHIATDVGDP